MLLVGLTTTVSPVAARLMGRLLRVYQKVVASRGLELRNHDVVGLDVGDVAAFEAAEGPLGLNVLDDDLAEPLLIVLVEDVEAIAGLDLVGGAEVDAGESLTALGGHLG